jgi:hypothetical protein
MDNIIHRLPGRVLVCALLSLAPAACSEQDVTDPRPARPQFSSAGATLLECPTNVTRSVEKTIDILGGELTLDGHSVTLPVGAVTVPTTIKLTVPASNYVEVDVTANGLEHFEFNEPVNIVISYQRCTRSNLANKTLTAWYIDGATKTLIEKMNSTDDRANMRVSFPTDHFSEYSVATN